MRQVGNPTGKSRSGSPFFFIGRDSHGNWVVQDQRHLCGGLFVNRTEALRFALFENGNQPQAVIMVPGILELDLRGEAASPSPSSNSNAPRLNRAA